MVSITKLYLGAEESFDQLRYGTLPWERKPVIVWNVTKRCNLFCKHCYASAKTSDAEKEKISTEKAKEILDDLSSFSVPVILFSGGEPLLREDIFEILDYARKRGLKTVLSTNGTLINEDAAKRIKDAGVSYVGISIDGIGDVNDIFRGKKGAFELATQGIRNLKKMKLKVGIRFTINRENYKFIPEVFDFFEKEEIDRICFYHLVYSGRGRNLMEIDLSPEERRGVLDYIIERTRTVFEKNKKIEVLTVDNHSDGPYIYLRLLKENPERAKKVYELLKKNGGNLSGVGIACIDEEGNVHPDQFWRDFTIGNVLERPFSEIWTDQSDPLFNSLKDKKKYLKGRCGRCNFIDMCGGNFRARAYAKTNDPWEEDPQCYLTDEEISQKWNILSQDQED